MNESSIESRVIRYLSEKASIEPEKISYKTTFREIGIDSLDIAEMSIDFESEYDIDLDLNRKSLNVGDLIQYIKSVYIEKYGEEDETN